MLHSRHAAVDFRFLIHLVADDVEIKPKKVRKKNTLKWLVFISLEILVFEKNKKKNTAFSSLN